MCTPVYVSVLNKLCLNTFAMHSSYNQQHNSNALATDIDHVVLYVWKFSWYVNFTVTKPMVKMLATFCCQGNGNNLHVKQLHLWLSCLAIKPHVDKTVRCENAKLENPKFPLIVIPTGLGLGFSAFANAKVCHHILCFLLDWLNGSWHWTSVFLTTKDAFFHKASTPFDTPATSFFAI